jgi:hypothetical protein
VRWFFSISPLGAFIFVFVLSFGFGCSSQPASAPASPGRPVDAWAASDPLLSTEGTAVPLVPQGNAANFASSELSRKVQIIIDRFVSKVFQMDGAAWFGLAALVAMLVFYTLENRSPFYILAFATACWMGSAYGYMRGSWPLEIVGGIWGLLALRKCWRNIQSKNGGAPNAEHLAAVWHIRFIGMLAVIAGMVLLIVDSPISVYLPIPISRAAAEAIPLLLVGIAYLAWLAIDRPPTLDLIKQVILAVAFVLWGVGLLMPSGQGSKFVGAMVIAIYVFDLAWLMEGNLRRKFGVHFANDADGCPSPDCRSAGVCGCDEISGHAQESHNGGRRAGAPIASSKK